MKSERVVRCRNLDNVWKEVAASELVFRLSIYGVCVREDKVLLHGYRDGWDFPGGGIERGETLDEAFEREFHEETGLSARRGRLLRVASDFFIHPTSDQPLHTLLMFFATEAISGEISTEFFDEHEKAVARAAEWKPLLELRMLKFYNPLSMDENIDLVNAAATSL
ncbi:MAG: NUDIX domain-containing protein [Candidatus Kaiserbacteria bacterium]|nr:NUDIX domain-containing protein [Candidatus Kaiserbacteria bacterium]